MNKYTWTTSIAATGLCLPMLAISVQAAPTTASATQVKDVPTAVAPEAELLGDYREVIDSAVEISQESFDTAEEYLAGDLSLEELNQGLDAALEEARSLNQERRQMPALSDAQTQQLRDSYSDQITRLQQQYVQLDQRIDAAVPAAQAQQLDQKQQQLRGTLASVLMLQDDRAEAAMSGEAQRGDPGDVELYGAGSNITSDRPADMDPAAGITQTDPAVSVEGDAGAAIGSGAHLSQPDTATPDRAPIGMDPARPDPTSEPLQPNTTGSVDVDVSQDRPTPGMRPADPHAADLTRRTAGAAAVDAETPEVTAQADADADMRVQGDSSDIRVDAEADTDADSDTELYGAGANITSDAPERDADATGDGDAPAEPADRPADAEDTGMYGAEANITDDASADTDADADTETESRPADASEEATDDAGMYGADANTTE
jgi:hypothetical protein